MSLFGFPAEDNFAGMGEGVWEDCVGRVVGRVMWGGSCGGLWDLRQCGMWQVEPSTLRCYAMQLSPHDAVET